MLNKTQKLIEPRFPLLSWKLNFLYALSSFVPSCFNYFVSEQHGPQERDKERRAVADRLATNATELSSHIPGRIPRVDSSISRCFLSLWPDTWTNIDNYIQVIYHRDPKHKWELTTQIECNFYETKSENNCQQYKFLLLAFIYNRNRRTDSSRGPNIKCAIMFLLGFSIRKQRFKWKSTECTLQCMYFVMKVCLDQCNMQL